MARPPLERVHQGSIAFWLVAWGVIVLIWWSQNAQGGGFFGPSFVAAIALFFFVCGAAVVGVLALIARFLLAGQMTRTVVVVGIPVVILASMFAVFRAQSPRFYPENTFGTGLTVEYVPEGFFFNSETLDSQRGEYDVLRSAVESEALMIGVLDPGVPFLPGEIVKRGDLQFVVSFDGEYTRVGRMVDDVEVEVASNALPAATLVSVAESITYDPEWDISVG